MLFASLNQLDFNATSRVDDIISWMYLLFYLFNDQELPGMNKFLEDHKVDHTHYSQVFKATKNYKKKFSLQKMLDMSIFVSDNPSIDTKIRGKVQKIITYVD